MINAIANYSLKEIDRATRDEFERDTLYKACVIGMTPIPFLELVVAAVLAWVLPGQMSMLSFLALVPSIVGNSIGSAWMRKRVATPLVSRNWAAIAVYLIPLIVMFAGIAYNAYAPADGHDPVSLSHRRRRRYHHGAHPRPLHSSPPAPPRPSSPRCRARGLVPLRHLTRPFALTADAGFL